MLFRSVVTGSSTSATATSSSSAFGTSSSSSTSSSPTASARAVAGLASQSFDSGSTAASSRFVAAGGVGRGVGSGEGEGAPQGLSSMRRAQVRGRCGCGTVFGRGWRGSRVDQLCLSREPRLLSRQDRPREVGVEEGGKQRGATRPLLLPTTPLPTAYLSQMAARLTIVDYAHRYAGPPSCPLRHSHPKASNLGLTCSIHRTLVSALFGVTLCKSTGYWDLGGRPGAGTRWGISGCDDGVSETTSGAPFSFVS